MIVTDNTQADNELCKPPIHGGLLVYEVIVIGGGAAGMMAAAAAADNGARVILLEKKERLGKKLRITGKGRCNLTSALEKDRLLSGYGKNGRFLYSAISEFSNQDLVDFFDTRGLRCKVERGFRVFPANNDAGSVVQVLSNNLVRAGVTIKTSCKVDEILITNGKVEGVRFNRGKILGRAVIIATGGMSYPATGSTGDGYRLALAAGHNIIEPVPGLVPLIVKEPWVMSLKGLSLKNVKATAYTEGQRLGEEFGEMLFTHFGLSGPIILTLSSKIAQRWRINKKPVTLSLDLKPALSGEVLNDRIQRDLSKFARRQFMNSLDELLPKKLIPVIIQLSGIDPRKKTSDINRSERKLLVNLLKDLRMTVIGTRPISEAIITIGGVDLKQIEPKSMESKLIKGLFFAGEILDIDGCTGGFNLQAAFSTGYVAGKNAALSK
jgi:predicted Rossmann fold flavoprotein